MAINADMLDQVHSFKLHMEKTFSFSIMALTFLECLLVSGLAIHN